MPSDEGMSIDERRKYLRLVAPRHALAKRRGGRKRALYHQPFHSTAATGALSTGYSQAAPAQAAAT